MIKSSMWKWWMKNETFHKKAFVGYWWFDNLKEKLTVSGTMSFMKVDIDQWTMVQCSIGNCSLNYGPNDHDHIFYRILIVWQSINNLSLSKDHSTFNWTIIKTSIGNLSKNNVKKIYRKLIFEQRSDHMTDLFGPLQEILYETLVIRQL